MHEQWHMCWQLEKKTCMPGGSRERKQKGHARWPGEPCVGMISPWGKPCVGACVCVQKARTALRGRTRCDCELGTGVLQVTLEPVENLVHRGREKRNSHWHDVVRLALGTRMTCRQQCSACGCAVHGLA